MTQQTRIDKGLYWDRAWSLVEGCMPVSSGCDHCWSAQQAHILAGQANPKIRARYGGLTDSQGRWTGKIRLMTQDLDKPLRVMKPTTWAIWNDLFHPDVPYSFVSQVFDVMRAAKQHVFLVLTKWLERRLNYIHMKQPVMPPHVWLGGSVSTQEDADRVVPIVLETPAAVRFVSVEPMLGPVYLRPDDDFFIPGKGSRWLGKSSNGIWTGLDWIIVGCESGPGRRFCDIDWIRSVIDQCVVSDTLCFLKQMEVNGKVVHMPELDGQVWDQMPGSER